MVLMHAHAVMRAHAVDAWHLQRETENLKGPTKGHG